jgi:hypothetical protein
VARPRSSWACISISRSGITARRAAMRSKVPKGSRMPSVSAKRMRRAPALRGCLGQGAAGSSGQRARRPRSRRRLRGRGSRAAHVNFGSSRSSQARSCFSLGADAGRRRAPRCRSGGHRDRRRRDVRRLHAAPDHQARGLGGPRRGDDAPDADSRSASPMAGMPISELGRRRSRRPGGVAMSQLSRARLNATPADCSPSRRVVSLMLPCPDCFRRLAQGHRCRA